MKTRSDRVTRSHIYPQGRHASEPSPKMRIVELPPGLLWRIWSGLKIGLIVATLVGLFGLWALGGFVANQEHFFAQFGGHGPRDSEWFLSVTQRFGWQVINMVMVIIVLITLPGGDIFRLFWYFVQRYRMNGLNRYMQKSGLFAESGVTIGAWPEGLLGLRPLKTREPVLFLDHAHGQALMPTLISWSTGGVVFDESAKLWEETSDVRARRGLRSLAIDFSNPRFGLRYDPIQMLRTDERAFHDCMELSQTLLVHGGICDNPDLHTQIEYILAACLMYARLSGEGLNGFNALLQMRDEDDFGYRLALCKLDWVADLGAAYMRIDPVRRVVLHQCTIQAGRKLSLLLPERTPGESQRLFDAIIDPQAPALIYFLAKSASMRDNPLLYNAVFRQLRSRMIEVARPEMNMLLATNDVAFLGPSACSLFTVPHTNLTLAAVLRPHWGKSSPSYDLWDDLAYAPVRVSVAMSNRDPATFDPVASLPYREIAHTSSKFRKLRVFEPY